MAEKNNAIISTSVKNYTQFNNSDRSKSKRFNIRLFNDLLNFQLYKADGEGKFGDKPEVDVYFKSLAYNEEILLNAIEEVLNRIKRMSKGEKIEKDKSTILIYNTTNFKEATSQLLFDAYTFEDKDKGDRPLVSVTLKRREKANDDNKWDKQMTIYFSTSNVTGVFYKGGSEFSEAYTYFKSLYEIIKGYTSRTSVKRDEHWKGFNKIRMEQNGSNNGGSSKAASVPDMDDDDFLF